MTAAALWTLIALCLAVGASLLSIDRAARPWPQPAPRAPIVSSGGAPRALPVVLAHGLGGFDAIRVPGARQDYFRGVAERLRALGIEVITPRVAPLSGIAARAGELAEQVRRLDAPRVNVIAHSMGGLDARYAIAELGLAGRIATLVTIGTPHCGTPLADGGVILSQLVGFHHALELVGAGWSAFEDLTLRRMAEFNRRVRDAPGVRYLSYVGRVRDARRANPLLRPSWRLLASRVGANDGLVPAASQRWGAVLGEVDADHWAQIGWSRQFDAASFYASVVERLSNESLGALVSSVTGAASRAPRACAPAPAP
jgi:triacylglycerol lipase